MSVGVKQIHAVSFAPCMARCVFVCADCGLPHGRKGGGPELDELLYELHRAKGGPHTSSSYAGGIPHRPSSHTAHN